MTTLGLSPSSSTWEVIAFLGAALVAAIALPYFAILFSRLSSSNSVWGVLLERAIRRAGEVPPDEPIVSFTFHTYAGFIVFFDQATHSPVLPARVASEYLRQLHLFNLVACLIPYPGCIFVPFISCINYLVQRRKIRLAAARA